MSLSLSISLSLSLYIYIYINTIKYPHPIPVYKIANNCSLVYWSILQSTGLNVHNDFVSIYSLWTSVSAITYLRCMFLQLGLNLEYIIEHRCHQHQIYIHNTGVTRGIQQGRCRFSHWGSLRCNGLAAQTFGNHALNKIWSVGVASWRNDIDIYSHEMSSYQNIFKLFSRFALWS